MKEVKYNQYVKEVLEQLPKGVFLNVKCKDKINTMTIGWGNIGFIWGKPIFTVLVRYSRYTYELLEKSREFTVSIPLSKDMKKELAFCGTKSGRDYDKFEECHITAVKGRKVETPIIQECQLHYECKVVFKQSMEPELLNTLINEKFYDNGNYHVMYYGEIVGTFFNE